MPKKRKMGPPRKSKSARPRTPTSFDAIVALRRKLDEGTINQAQFRRLIHLEEMRNEWAARVQLRSIARDLLPQAASQARKGRSRLLANVASILLKSEMSDLAQRSSIERGMTLEEAEHVQHEQLAAWSPYLAELVESRRREKQQEEDAERGAAQYASLAPEK